MPTPAARWSVFRRRTLFLLLLGAVAASATLRPHRVVKESVAAELQAIPPSEFSRLIRTFSEEDGYFRSDNFTSNETSYLQVVDLLRRSGVSGGAYIGVGPEQNFTYIAKMRPEIAFIVDIRRQAMLQHLLYKAIFQQAETRAQFLALLLCRPPPGKDSPPHDAAVSDLLEFFSRDRSGPSELFARYLARARRVIQEEFRFPLTDSDPARLEYVYSAFRTMGLDVSFRFGGGTGYGYGWFPTLADLIMQKDPQGRLGNFLASDDDYQFVRRLQRLNRIIPVVGDFAGPKALASVGRYLAGHHYVVSAFYTSNVEQFLFQNGGYDYFLENVRALPADDRSVFIRAVARMGQAHPAHLAGHRTTTLLQRISVFLHDEDTRPYKNYWDLVTTHYIGSEQR
jgi:hypothetical protein